MSERRAFSVSVFARHGGKILLIRHRRLGTWLPAGGEIEPGETPLEAARRELLEETGLHGRFEAGGSGAGTGARDRGAGADAVFAADGLRAVDGSPPGLLGYEEHQAGAKGLHLNFAFVAEVETDRVHAQDGHAEFDEHRWIGDLRELIELDAPRNVRELGALALRWRGGTQESDAAGADEAVALVDLARAWLAAFNARALERLLALYAEDAVHHSPKLRASWPETEGRVRGTSALREWWSDCFARLPGLHYAERAISTSSGRVVLEYARELPGEPTLAIAEVFVVRNRLIVESRVHHG